MALRYTIISEVLCKMHNGEGVFFVFFFTFYSNNRSHTMLSEACRKKWEECNLNEDYWRACDSLNSSGFVLPPTLKSLCSKFYCLRIICQTATRFKPLFKQCPHSQQILIRPFSSAEREPCNTPQASSPTCTAP